MVRQLNESRESCELQVAQAASKRYLIPVVAEAPGHLRQQHRHGSTAVVTLALQCQSHCGVGKHRRSLEALHSGLFSMQHNLAGDVADEALDPHPLE